MAHLIATGVEKFSLRERAPGEDRLRKAMERFHAPDIVDRRVAELGKSAGKLTLGAAILAESWYRAQPPGQSPGASARPRALLLSAFLVLAAFAPLVLSPLPAIQQFGDLLLVALGLSLVALFVLLPQLRVWTAPRRRRQADTAEEG